MSNKLKSKKIIYLLLGLILIVATTPLFSAFEAHIVNVTATIDNPVEILTPNSGEVLSIGECYTITWKADNELPRLDDVSSIDLYYSTDGGNTYPNKIAVGEANDGYYKWKVPNDPTDQGRIMVLAHYDGTNAPNQVDYSDEDFDITYTVDENTIALWHFDEGSGSTAFDETKNDNDGTLMPASPTWVTGQSGNASDLALEFDGEDDYVEVPDSDSLDITDEITIEAWVYWKGFNNYQVILQKRGSPHAYELLLTSTGKIYGYIHDGAWYGGTSTNAVPTNTWTHVAMTYDGSVIKYFINEVEDPTIYSHTGSIDVNNNPIYIGIWNDASKYPFNGIIDEVRISNIARDFNENNCDNDGEDSPAPVPPKPGKVVINELMWAGSSKNDKDQWIELKNISDKNLNLKGCKLTYYSDSENENKLTDLPDDTDIILNSGNYYLISHYTKGYSNIDIIPDFGGTLKVKNFDYDKFQIKLYCPDTASNMVKIDSVGDGNSFPVFGSSESPKKSMERCDDGTWHTATTHINWDEGANEKGTPGAENSSCLE